MQSDALTFHIAAEWKNLAREAEYLNSALDLSRNDSLPKAHRHLDVIVLMGMASSLEKCYSGMERILKILAENLDDYVPKGDAWHKLLINQMSSCVGQRNPVISNNTAQGLHELRAFRYRERNSYSLDLDKIRIMELGERVFVVMASLKSDLSDKLRIAGIVEIARSQADAYSPAATSLEQAFHKGTLPRPDAGTLTGTVRALVKDADMSAFALVENADDQAFAVPVSNAHWKQLVVGGEAAFDVKRPTLNAFVEVFQERIAAYPETRPETTGNAPTSREKLSSSHKKSGGPK